MRWFLLVVLLVAGSAQAQSVLLQEGYPVCRSADALVDFRAAAGASDMGSMRAIVNSGRCVISAAGVRVTVLEIPGVFSSDTVIMYDGIRLWTMFRALDFP